MFIERDLEKFIKKGLSQVPILAIIGPRQSGKSTLIKKIFKEYVYLDMQDADIFDFANNDPKGFLQHYKNTPGVIIDEAQYAPRLFSQLKVEVDKNPKMGHYILAGSQNFLLHEKISESLAGRVYFYKLLPFSIKELKQASLLQASPLDQIIKGFYPRVFQPTVSPQTYYENYISTYVERDIRTIKNIENILIFKKFMQLCALRIGTPLNFTDLATNCGISIATAKTWLTLLETSFVLFLLPSYHENLGKRITKSPKLYFYDVGLAAALMGVDRETIVQKRMLYGSLFENMIIVDIIKNNHAQEFKKTLTFFRDSNQNEVDLIIESHNTLIAAEIKSSTTINTNFFDTLLWFKEQIKNHNIQCLPMVIYGGNENQKRSNGNICSWQNLETLDAK